MKDMSAKEWTLLSMASLTPLVLFLVSEGSCDDINSSDKPLGGDLSEPRDSPGQCRGCCRSTGGG